MNSKKTIALFAVIAAVAISTISLADISAVPLMVSSVPQTYESTGILGHVEYTLRDSDGLVKGYHQGDNSVVDAGKDCVSAYMFDQSGGGSCAGLLTSPFEYVAIGNVTDGAIPSDSPAVQLDSLTNRCALTGAGGEMARIPAATTLLTAANEATNGAIIELDTVANPFSFDITNASNTQVIFQSGIFNAGYATPNGNNICVSEGAMGTADNNWNMFAIQNLNPGSGITVTPGDSLSVKWTITVG